MLYSYEAMNDKEFSDSFNEYGDVIKNGAYPTTISNENDTEFRSERSARLTTSKSFSFSRAASSEELVRQRSIRRRKDFQQSCLRTAVKLLFLDESYAVAFSAPLDASVRFIGGVQPSQFLQPFLESLSSEESGFQCIALLMFRFLLCSGASVENDCQFVGYDAVSDVITSLRRFLVGPKLYLNFFLTSLTLSTSEDKERIQSPWRSSFFSFCES